MLGPHILASASGHRPLLAHLGFCLLWCVNCAPHLPACMFLVHLSAFGRLWQTFCMHRHALAVSKPSVHNNHAAAGNKLFQGTLIGIMSPGATVVQVSSSGCVPCI